MEPFDALLAAFGIHLLGVGFLILVCAIIWFFLFLFNAIFKPFDGVKLFGEEFSSDDFTVCAFMSLFFGPVTFFVAFYSNDIDTVSGSLGAIFTCLGYIIFYLIMTS